MLRTFAIFLLSATAAAAAAETRPNVVWILVDDMSADFGCYGQRLIETPNVDRLAREGTRFSRAFTTAPVCSPSRSALITGMYQTSIGAHHHRSGRGEMKLRLPEGVATLPQLFQAAGYYTCIGDGASEVGKARKGKGAGLGKTDYNFETPASYDGADWSGRAPGQPFFMQVTLAGGKLRGGTDDTARKLSARAAGVFGAAVRPEDVVLPPYYPRDPVLLRDWAAYLEACRFTDRAVGELLARLEREQLLERTIVVFLTDHGISHARGKQFLYDEGIRIPLVIRGPGVPRGLVRDDLVEHIDLAATTLAWAGLPVPSCMQGRDLFAADHRPRDAVFAARDRCDETVDHLRSVRTDRFKYVRNFFPARPSLQPNNYKDHKSIVETLRALHAAGALDPLPEALLFQPSRPAEELYDLTADPFETRNLADDPAHRAVLETLRGRLDRWMVETGDRGRTPEPDSQYDSDMRAYLAEAKRDDARRREIERNIGQMKAWAAEGK